MASAAPIPPEGKEPQDGTTAEVEFIEPLTVVQALSRVMGDVQSISKNSRNTSQNFNFRGIDAVMNAVGPALREHGVVVVPINTRYDAEHYESRQGAKMKNVTLTVWFRFYGPKGDYIEACATGEAADSGDKAMPKAHSVAFRTLLLQALCIPTDEPDPDASSHERATHDSGFRGGSRSDPQPERRVEAPPYNWPTSPSELFERMSALLGKENAREWVAQAMTLVTGEHEPLYSGLPEAEQRKVWDVLTQTLHTLETSGEGDLELHPTPRETISAAFAQHLDGQILNGPPWALTGTEAEKGYPAKADVLAGRQAEADAEADQIPLEGEEAALEAAAAAAEAEYDAEAG